MTFKISVYDAMTLPLLAPLLHSHQLTKFCPSHMKSAQAPLC